MDSTADTFTVPPGTSSWRCARCGIESPERTCFVIPLLHSKPPYDTRCMTCERRAQARALPVRFCRYMVALWVPVVIFSAEAHEPMSNIVRAALLMGIFAPLALLIHELGHLVTAGLCGLEVGGLGLGQGRKLWSGTVLGVPVRILAWPLLGRVYLGGYRLQALPARVALVTCMGPGANALMVWATIAFWDRAVLSIGFSALFAWAYVNALMALSNLMPYRVADGGVLYHSDGLALWRLLRGQFKGLELPVSALLMRAVACIEARRYAQAIEFAQTALARAPTHRGARYLLAAACHQHYDFRRAADLAEALLAETDLPPLLRAYVQQFQILGRLVVRSDLTSDAGPSIDVDRLSQEAFLRFPCELSIRSIRALVLLSQHCPHDALALLDYSHYEHATAIEAGDRAALRFCAYQQLSHWTDADPERARAQQLHPDSLRWLVLMGLARPEQIAPITVESR